MKDILKHHCHRLNCQSLAAAGDQLKSYLSIEEYILIAGILAVTRMVLFLKYRSEYVYPISDP